MKHKYSTFTGQLVFGERMPTVPVGGIERREGRRARAREAENPDTDPNSSVKRRGGLKIRLV